MRVVWIAVGSIVLAGTAVAAPPAPDGFAIPTGRVTYSIESPAVHGKTVLIWTGSGRKFRQEINGTVGAKGKTKPMSGWTLCDGKFIYTYEKSMGKKVVRQDLPKGGATGSIPMIGLSKDVGTVVGKETLLGKPCEIREVGQARFSVWQNLPLKMIATGAKGMSISMVATKLEPNVRVSAGTFQLPPGYSVNTATTRRVPMPAPKAKR